MYIRTTCGVLGILKHIKLNMYEFNNERYIKNGKRLHNSNHDYTIKLQDEELIDVLKVGDDCYFEKNSWFRITDKSINRIQTIGSGGKFILQLPTFTNIWQQDLKKVITHEQYMPLAQEVL